MKRLKPPDDTEPRALARAESQDSCEPRALARAEPQSERKHAEPLPPSAVSVYYWLGAASVYLVAFGLLETRLWQGGKVFDGRANCQIAEAHSWWSGRLDLRERIWDTAGAGGRVYSHFPLMFSFLAAGVVPAFGNVPHWFVLLVVVGPIPLLAYVLFQRLTASPTWGALLAIGYLCGTSLWPIIDATLRTASPYYVNHSLASLGLMIMLIEYVGERRVGVAGAGLIIATLSRQMTAAFAIPLLWLVLRDRPPEERRRELVVPVLIALVVAGVPLTANALKFGHPLETGYSLIYEGRDDGFARDARSHGLFSARFVPRNLYYMNLGFPVVHRIEMAGKTEYHLQPNIMGTGIWWTTPLLLWLVVDIRRILSDPASRVLFVAAAVVYVALMFFHATGQEQRGFNRFSLDFLPALLAVIAPKCFAYRRRWISVAMVAWSVLYFRWLI